MNVNTEYPDKKTAEIGRNILSACKDQSLTISKIISQVEGEEKRIKEIVAALVTSGLLYANGRTKGACYRTIPK